MGHTGTGPHGSSNGRINEDMIGSIVKHFDEVTQPELRLFAGFNKNGLPLTSPTTGIYLNASRFKAVADSEALRACGEFIDTSVKELSSAGQGPVEAFACAADSGSLDKNNAFLIVAVFDNQKGASEYVQDNLSFEKTARVIKVATLY